MSVYQQALKNAFHVILAYYRLFDTHRTVYTYLGQFNLYPCITSIINLH